MTDTAELDSTEQEDDTNYLDMSDDDFLKQPEPLVSENAEDDTASDPGEGEEAGDDTGADDGNSEDEAEAGEGSSESAEAGSKPFTDEEGEETGKDGDPDKTEQTKSPDAGTLEDYKARYEAVLAPFKANGKEIKVDTPEDLRRLAQMGVNYTSKMQVMKPKLKLLKMLENNGLSDESKLSFLIDLSKKDANAINKLVKDSGINPLDIDTESTEGYTPNTYTVNDKQFNLNEALEDLKESPTYSDTIDVISNKWDEASRRVLADSPEIISVIDGHMQSGVYAEISKVLDREKLLGKIPQGLSDLDAYKHIGDKLYATGAPSTGQPANSSANSTNAPDANAQRDEKRNKRKRAAGTTRSKPAKQASLPVNALALSDEEFEKLMPSHL